MNIPKQTLEHYGMSEHEYKWRFAKHQALAELEELELKEIAQNGDTYFRNAIKEAQEILVEKWGEHIVHGPIYKDFFEEHSNEDNSKE